MYNLSKGLSFTWLTFLFQLAKLLKFSDFYKYYTKKVSQNGKLLAISAPNSCPAPSLSFID